MGIGVSVALAGTLPAVVMSVRAPAPEVTLGSPDTVGWVLLVFFNIVQGATGEELGWRGIALPRLQARYSRLVAAIVLGLLISGWHSILHLIDPKPVPEWQFSRSRTDPHQRRETL